MQLFNVNIIIKLNQNYLIICYKKYSFDLEDLIIIINLIIMYLYLFMIHPLIKYLVMFRSLVIINNL